LPILEAQSVGCPVVAGDNSSIREITTTSSPLSLGEDARRAGEGFPQGQRGNVESEIQNRPLTPSLVRRGDMESASLVDVNSAEQIADAAYKLISDKNLRDDIIKRGYENVKRFSWEKCADKIAKIMKHGSK